MSNLPRREDPVRILTGDSPRHLLAYQRGTVDPSGPDKLIAIARQHPDGSGRWSVVVRGGTDRISFDNEVAVRVFLLGLLDGGDQ
jgi:hypothetical protein